MYRDARITFNVSARWSAETFFFFLHGLVNSPSVWLRLTSPAQRQQSEQLPMVTACHEGLLLTEGDISSVLIFWERFISLDTFSMRK